MRFYLAVQIHPTLGRGGPAALRRITGGNPKDVVICKHMLDVICELRWKAGPGDIFAIRYKLWLFMKIVAQTPKL